MSQEDLPSRNDKGQVPAHKDRFKLPGGSVIGKQNKCLR